MNISIKEIVIALSSVVVTILVVYLTPLKNLNIVEPTIKDVDPKAFYTEFLKNKDGFVFVDVRPREAYNAVHAEGSINIPLHTLYDERHNLPKRGKQIVLICSGGRASGVAYGYLEHHGFLNLQRIDGGIEKWLADGLPIVSSRALDEIKDILDKEKVSSVVIPCEVS
ncbi:MAG: rhodanese-like domain-containing protein [Candidatus Paceibacterota bacterium]|jgi:rhodanese-related sulfurtransferase